MAAVNDIDSGAPRFRVVTTGAWALLAVLALDTGSARADQYQYDAIGRLIQVQYSSGGITAYTYDANSNVLSVVSSLPATGVEEASEAERFEFALGQSAPNPGSGNTTVHFSVPSRGRVVLRLFDVSGRLVSTPVDAVLGPGRYSGRLVARALAGGVYFYRLEWAGKSLSRRLVVLP